MPAGKERNPQDARPFTSSSIINYKGKWGDFARCGNSGQTGNSGNSGGSGNSQCGSGHSRGISPETNMPKGSEPIQSPPKDKPLVRQRSK